MGRNKTKKKFAYHKYTTGLESCILDAFFPLLDSDFYPDKREIAFETGAIAFITLAQTTRFVTRCRAWFSKDVPTPVRHMEKEAGKMGSMSSEVRTRQKEAAEAALKAYEKELADKSVDAKTSKRDPLLRHLTAELRKARLRLLAIDGRKAHVEKTRADKATAAEQGMKTEAAPAPKKEPKAKGKKKEPAAE